MFKEKTTVFIVHSDDDTRRLIRKMLGNKFMVFEAKSGIGVVDMTLTHKPNVILLDMFTPGIFGQTACSELQNDERTRGIPLVAISGWGGPIEEKLFLAMGAKGYLRMSFTEKELMDIITPPLEVCRI